MAYATVLMLISFLVLKNSIPPGAQTASDYLGCGPAVMLAIGFAQQIGLQLVLPALACGAFTVEKERNTLGLLFLTKLGPWTILLEKFLSRLLLAWSFVVISAPVLAFCYGLGGITIDVLVAQVLSLLVSSFTIVSICILCSTYFRTTAAALLASYALIFLLRILLQVWLYQGLLMAGTIGAADLLRSVVLLGGISVEDSPYLKWGFSPLYGTVLLCLPWLLISLVSLRLARRLLVTRAFLPPSNPLRRAWQWLDGVFDRANRNPITRGIIVLRPAHRIPDQDPVAWRETTTRSLGQVSYLIRLLILVEAPVLAILCIRGMIDLDREGLGMVLVLQVVAWVVLILLTCILSAGLIAGERARQTLDTLLVTPMSSREIVRQKMAGVMRLIWICSVPLWTCLLLRIATDGILYFLIQASMLLIYPRQVAWIAMWHGLRAKTALAAVFKCLLDILLRCVVPFLLFTELAPMLLARGDGGLRQFFSILSFSSPLTMLIFSEIPASSRMGEFHLLANLAYNLPVAILLNTAFHYWMLQRIQSKCLDRADVMLGRKKTSGLEAPAVEEYLRSSQARWNATLNRELVSHATIEERGGTKPEYPYELVPPGPPEN